MIELKGLCDSDSPVLFEWLQDRAYRLESGGFEHIGWAAHQHWFSSVQGRSDQIALAVRRTDDQVLVGLVQLVDINQLYRHAELRIRLAPSELSKGYGTQATQLLCEYGFQDLNLNRIFLHVRESNARAIRCYKKAGFRVEGCLRQHGFVDGKYEDFAVMGLLREEYESVNF